MLVTLIVYALATPVAWSGVICGPMPCSVVHSHFSSHSVRALGSVVAGDVSFRFTFFQQCSRLAHLYSAAAWDMLLILCASLSAILCASLCALSTRAEGPTPLCTLVTWGGIIPWHQRMSPLMDISCYIFYGAPGVVFMQAVVSTLALIVSSILALTLSFTCTSHLHPVYSSDLVLIHSSFCPHSLSPV